MESVIADISDLKLEEKYQRFRHFTNTLVAVNFPDCEAATQGRLIPEDRRDLYRAEYDDEAEKNARDELEAKITEAELESVQLLYIPDHIRELGNKVEYWKKEYQFWNDLISEKNWKKYEKELNEAIVKLKTVTKNLDKKLLRIEKKENLFSDSFDPERVQTLVNYIKEKESNDRVLEAMLDAAFFCFNYVERAYIKYAIYAKYGEYRLYPSRPYSSRVKNESDN